MPIQEGLCQPLSFLLSKRAIQVMINCLVLVVFVALVVDREGHRHASGE